MDHSFNVEVAMVAGILPATIFNSIGYWMKTNEANGHNCINGKVWTYNTVEAWARLFPYATKKQVEKALAKLREAGLVETDCFNEDRRDRSLWYTLSPVGQAIFDGLSVEGAGECISPNGEMEFPKRGNDYILYTDSKHAISKQDTFPQFVEEVVSYLNDRTGKSFRASSKQTRSLIHARAKEGYTLDDFRRVIDVKCSQWLNDPKMSKYLQPSTLFGTKFEGYANEQPPRQRADYSGVMSGWKVEHWGDAHGS